VSASLPNISPAAGYTDAATLRAPMTARVNLIVQNNAIYWQRGEGLGGLNWPHPEEHLPPGYYSFDIPCDAVRVRRASSALAATVSITARTAQEVTGGA
jgi:hypothetical protein